MLKGRASVIVRSLKIEEVSCAGGLEKIFGTLEASPMVKELDGNAESCWRQPGDSMESFSFIMHVQAQRIVMEEEDPTFAVGDRFMVTLRDSAMVLAAAQNQMATEAIFPALRRMGPFLNGTVPIGKGVLDNLLLPELQQGDQSTSSARKASLGSPSRRRWPWRSRW